ncbi:cuticle protein 19.8-like [Amphibalanus amphitrite]|nr:cuticle protein 19.8-like [Amphibalanus amphitrite]XP_043235372.1 cuticle protein 19.8-like [Amphibalanus amphitrite]
MKVLLISALVAVALAAPQKYAQQQYSDAPAKYAYDYKVQDSNYAVDFGQSESRDGANTQGSYYVALPDGRVQRVTYSVSGDGGYVAEVTYEGEARYPAASASQPAYRPAGKQQPYN